MNPPMYRRIRDWFVDSGLTDGFVVQHPIWVEGNDKSKPYIVFRPNGGSAIQKELGADYYILVDIISTKTNTEQATVTASSIIDFVQSNPMPNDCIGHIQNTGGFPSPILTTEGRIVFRIQFAVIYGE